MLIYHHTSMDILKQYEKENPEISHVSASQEFREESFLVPMVMRLSGGRIQDRRQISYILFGVIIFCLISAVFIYSILGPEMVPPIKSITTQDVLPR